MQPSKDSSKPAPRFDSATFRRHYAQMEAGEDRSPGASENGNMGRIFVIILLLHVFGLVAVILFNLFSGDSKPVSNPSKTSDTLSPPVAALQEIHVNPEDVDEYRIRSGQNLDDILSETGATKEQLFALNNVTSPDQFVLQVGKKIRVPRKMEVHRATPIPAEQAQEILNQGKPSLVADELMSNATPVASLAPAADAVPVAPAVMEEEVPVAKPVEAPKKPEPAPVVTKKTEPAPVKKPELAPVVVKKPEPAPVKKPEVAKKPEPAPAPVVKAPEKPKAPEVAKSSGTVHEVKAKETVYSISRKYGVSVNKLMEINGVKDPNRLGVGAKLKIPAKN